MSDLMTAPDRSRETGPDLSSQPTSAFDGVGTYFLVQVENQIDMADLVSEMQGLPGVVSATRVVGPYDVITEARGRGKDIRDELAAALSKIPGVIRVVTMPTATSKDGSDDSSWAA